MSNKKEHYNQGLDLFGQAHYEEAIAEYDQAIACDPNDGELYLAKSMAYHRMKDLDRALEAAKQAVVLSPREPLFYTNLSRIYQQKGMIDEAEEAMAISRQLSMGF